MPSSISPAGVCWGSGVPYGATRVTSLPCGGRRPLVWPALRRGSRLHEGVAVRPAVVRRVRAGLRRDARGHRFGTQCCRDHAGRADVSRAQSGDPGSARAPETAGREPDRGDRFGPGLRARRQQRSGRGHAASRAAGCAGVQGHPALRRNASCRSCPRACVARPRARGRSRWARSSGIRGRAS